MSHSMRIKRLAHKLGVKYKAPGDLLKRMHELKGMPKKKHHKGYSDGDGLKEPSFKHKKLPKTFGGKSTKPGMGGRAKMLEAKGVPKGVIGAIARSKGEAPGQAGFHHGKHHKAEPDFKKHEKHMKMACKINHVHTKSCKR